MEEGGLREWNTAGFGRRVTAHDPFGAVAQVTLGNGLTDVRGYSAFTGALTSLCVGTPGSTRTLSPEVEQGAELRRLKAALIAELQAAGGWPAAELGKFRDLPATLRTAAPIG